MTIQLKPISHQAPQKDSAPSKTECGMEKVGLRIVEPYSKTVIRDSQSSLKASIFIENTSTGKRVVKHFYHAHPLLKSTVCKFLLHRERASLLRLKTVEGVPRYQVAYGKYGIAIQFIEGAHPTPEHFYRSAANMQALESLVSEFHSLGLTHNDLHWKNFILSKHDQLTIIDYGSAFIRPNSTFCGFLSAGGLLFDFLKKQEEAKLIRLKSQTRNLNLSESERDIAAKYHSVRRLTRLWKALRKRCKHW